MRFTSKSSLFLVAIAAAGIAALLAGSELSAKPKGFAHLKLPGGTSVQQLSIGRFHVNGAGIDGTYTCRCEGGANATGTCSTTQSGGVLTCGKSGDSCTGTCAMSSTTSGGGKLSIY
jgi:hypothetical protein